MTEQISIHHPQDENESIFYQVKVLFRNYILF